MYYVYVFMQRRMQNSHVIITQLRKLVVPPLNVNCHLLIGLQLKQLAPLKPAATGYK